MLSLNRTPAQKFYEKVLSREWRYVVSRRKILKVLSTVLVLSGERCPKVFFGNTLF